MATKPWKSKVVTARSRFNNHLLELLGTNETGRIEVKCIEPGCPDAPYVGNISLDNLYDFSWYERR